jgi:hypothetical protein
MTRARTKQVSIAARNDRVVLGPDMGGRFPALGPDMGGRFPALGPDMGGRFPIA